MVGEDEPVRTTEYDTAELESEISKLRTQLRKPDPEDPEDPRKFKRRKRWQFHCKWKRKRKKDHEDVFLLIMTLRRFCAECTC